MDSTGGMTALRLVLVMLDVIIDYHIYVCVVIYIYLPAIQII